MTEYVENKSLQEAIDAMANNEDYDEFEQIRAQEIKIVSLVKVVTDAKGEEPEPKGPGIICAKISPPLQVITGAHYLITANNYFWTHANDIQQAAALHNALKKINVVITDSGKISLGTSKPDVVGYQDTVERFGAWDTSLLSLRDALKTASDRLAKSLKTA